MTERSPRVLVFAYDAHPAQGSESASGWGVTRSLTRFARCTAVVAAPTAAALQRHVAAHPELGLTVLGVPDSALQRLGRKLASFHRQLEFLSYLAWLRGARSLARAHLAADPHDVAIHASYGVYWLPSPVVDVGLPSVWGPVGGGVRSPVSLLRHLGWKGLLGEFERSLLLGIASRLPATRNTARRATVVMAENEATRDRIPASEADRASLLNRAVFAPVPDVERSTERASYLLFPSSLQGRKGPRLAVEALARTRPHVRLVFVADGYERPTLERLADELGVRDRVELLGRVPRDEYFRRVTEAAAVVFTGLREEGGAALVEAMKLGVPVVVLDHGGSGWIARQATDPRRVWRVPVTGASTAVALAAAMDEASTAAPGDDTPLLDTAALDRRLEDAVTAAVEAPVAAGAAGPPGRRRVVFVERQIRAYRRGFLRELAIELAAHDIDLVAVDEERHADARPWDRLESEEAPVVSVPTRVVRVGHRDLVWMSLGAMLRPEDLVVMPQQTKQLALYHLLRRQGRGGPRVALWGHGFTPSESRHAAPRAAKRWLSTTPHWWFAYTDETAELVASFGYPEDRITTVRNATDTRRLQAHLAGTTEDEIAALRAEIGLESRRVATFAGSFREEKKLGFLLAGMEAARQRVPDLELVLAGDGEEAAFVEAAARRHPWVHVVGPRLDADLAPLLRLSDVLVVPSWVGLVVVDGFAAGVPLIASASAEHPPEIRYIEDGVNGRLVDDDGDPTTYGEAVADVLLDRALHARLAAGALRTGETFSAEDMAREFAAGVLAAFRAPRLARGRRRRLSRPPGPA